MAQQRQAAPSETLLHAEAELADSTGATIAATESEQVPATRVSSPGRDAWRRFRANWAAMACLTTIGILVFMAIFAPFMHTADPMGQDYSALHQGASAHHWFGTDGLGRDLYSRLVYGLRVPLIVGIVGTVITCLLGSFIGVIGGYFGGVTDSILSRFTDFIFAFPAFLLALLLVTLFGQSLDSYFPAGAGRVVLLTIIFAVVGWPALMRFVRSLALSLREQQFVEAARTSGTSHLRILIRHLLPNMWGLILIQSSFLVVGFIYNEAVLSILGLGVQPPNPDLGAMVFAGAQDMDLNPVEILFPAGLLTIIIVAFTFLGDGIRDAVDPRMNS